MKGLTSKEHLFLRVLLVVALIDGISFFALSQHPDHVTNPWEFASFAAWVTAVTLFVLTVNLEFWWRYLRRTDKQRFSGFWWKLPEKEGQMKEAGKAIALMAVAGIVITIVIADLIVDALTPTKSLAFTYRLIVNVCVVITFVSIASRTLLAYERKKETINDYRTSAGYVGGFLFSIGWVLFVLGLSTFLCGSPWWGANCFHLGLLVASGLVLFGLIFVGGGMFLVGRSSGRTRTLEPGRSSI